MYKRGIFKIKSYNSVFFIHVSKQYGLEQRSFEHLIL